MPKGIIKHNDVRLKSVDRQQAGLKSIFSDNNRYIFKAAGNKKWFITGLFRIHQQVPAVADNAAVSFSTAFVAATDNGNTNTYLL